MSANAVYPVWVVPRIMVQFPGMDTINFSIGTLFRYTLEDIMMDASYYGDKSAYSHNIVEVLEDMHLVGQSEILIDARNRAKAAIMSNVPTGTSINFADLVMAVKDHMGFDAEPTIANADRVGLILAAWKAAVDNETCTCSFYANGVPASGCDFHGII